MRYSVQCDCTYRGKNLQLIADSIFDIEYISHGQSTASPSGTILSQGNLENNVPSLSFLGKTSVVTVGWFVSLGWIVPIIPTHDNWPCSRIVCYPIVPTNFEFQFSSSQASSDELASFFVRFNNFEMIVSLSVHELPLWLFAGPQTADFLWEQKDSNLLFYQKNKHVFEKLGGNCPVVPLWLQAWLPAITSSHKLSKLSPSSLWCDSSWAFCAFSEVVLLKCFSNASFSFSALGFVCPSFSLLLTAT